MRLATVSFPSVILWVCSLSSFSVRKVVGLVAEPDGHMTLAVLLACDSASLTIVDVSLAKRRAAGDLPGLLLAVGVVLCVDVHDAVGVLGCPV